MLSISLITVGDPETLTGGYLYHRRLAELAHRHDARIEFVSFPASAFPLPVLRGREIVRRGAAWGPGVVVVDSIAAAYVAPWLRLLPPDVPVVGMLHQPPGGIDHGSLRSGIQASFDKVAYGRAELLLVASLSLADTLRTLGITVPLEVVAPGRDPAPAPEEIKEDLRQGTLAAFLCVANWTQRKGLLELLDAFCRLPPGAGRLHLVGDRAAQPRYASRIRSRLRDEDLAGRVVVHGRVSKERVAGLYEKSDVFVLPSFKEPYGTVYGEAMASGLPVVGWRGGNLPYLARDGKEGVLVPPGDVVALGSALEKLAREEAFRIRMGEAARVRSLSFPTWEETAERFFGALRAVGPK